jgi:hypothetical protein
MAVELFRSLNSAEELDLSHYRPNFSRREQYQRDQLADWMLYLVDQKKAADQEQLLTLIKPALFIRHHPVLQALGVEEEPIEEKTANLALQRAVEQGWLLLEPPIELTPAGKQRLAQQMHHARRGGRHRRMLYV